MHSNLSHGAHRSGRLGFCARDDESWRSFPLALETSLQKICTLLHFWYIFHSISSRRDETARQCFQGKDWPSERRHFATLSTLPAKSTAVSLEMPHRARLVSSKSSAVSRLLIYMALRHVGPVARQRGKAWPSAEMAYGYERPSESQSESRLVSRAQHLASTTPIVVVSRIDSVVFCDFCSTPLGSSTSAQPASSVRGSTRIIDRDRRDGLCSGKREAGGQRDRRAVEHAYGGELEHRGSAQAV